MQPHSVPTVIAKRITGRQVEYSYLPPTFVEINTLAVELVNEVSVEAKNSSVTLHCESNMKEYWCVNFDNEENLRHGIENRCWMMGYQYPRPGQPPSDKNHLISSNWRRLLEISNGDEFVAYLKPNLFFATGKVTTPHRRKRPSDKTDTIEEYLERKKPYSKGVIYFTDVVYENFTDGMNYYPVRIDVDVWTNFQNDGVSTKVIGDLGPNQIQMAAFRISKAKFDRISNDLVLGKTTESRSKSKRKVYPGLEDSSGTTVSKSGSSKNQGMVVDSELRKRIEKYSMARAIAHFESAGYTVLDQSKNSSFDLECIKGREQLYVEVKGTRTKGEGVILTANEVEFARKNRAKMVLFVVQSIEVVGKKLTKGFDRIIKPWDVDQGELASISFRYKVPTPKTKNR